MVGGVVAGGWIIAKAVHPSWCTLQVPGDICEMLGIPLEEAARLSKMQRGLYFLARKEGLVRVINARHTLLTVDREMAQGLVLAQASPSEKMIFTLPDEVERHLDLEVFQRGRPGVTGTHDVVAWAVPQEEWYAYRKAKYGGRAYIPPPPDGAHVYLAKCLFLGLFPTFASLESDVPVGKKAGVSPRQHRVD